MYVCTTVQRIDIARKRLIDGLCTPRGCSNVYVVQNLPACQISACNLSHMTMQRAIVKVEKRFFGHGLAISCF